MDQSAESETPRLPSLNRRSLLEFLAFIEVMDLDSCGMNGLGGLLHSLSRIQFGLWQMLLVKE